MQFVDECNLYLKAGNGGNGIVSWRREANVPEGGPYGGDGGDGGNIIIIGDHNVNTLFEWGNHKQIIARNGENGRTAQETGKGAKDTYINVPLGTSIYDQRNNELICDILESGQTFVVCEGGKGGRGNTFFKSSINRAPTLHENGDIGQERYVKLKLRYIADVCLIGLPNAGKSTFVSQISNAKPKIANYQFTTLIPVLGIVKIHDDNLVFADMPGLIEGASEGKGLGHEFLKHIERCQIFIHLISMNPIDNEDVNNAYRIINSEVEKYNRELIDKPIIVVANKKDINDTETNYLKLKKLLKKQKVFFISAKENDGIDKVLEEVYEKYSVIKKNNEQKLLEQKQNIKVIEIKKQKDFNQDLKIIKLDERVWEVQSEFMKYWTHKIPLDTKDNIIRYNQKMLTLGVEAKAKASGAQAGDTLKIYGNDFVID